MTILKNNRWEKFALAFFGGENKTQSAISAGYSPTSARSTATVLLKNPCILERIQELQEAVASEKIMSVIERRERLSEIAGARLTDFVKVEGESITIDLEVDKNAALQEVAIDEWKGGKDQRAESRTSKVKLINPITAIAELNKMDGDYAPEKHKIEGDIPVSIVYKLKESEGKE